MPDRKRCAIYTRKSSEEGLEQEFNSLDAQAEACSAYILSQANEGWEQTSEQYDDGGWSGGNMDRPALKQLLADVEAGKVDTIVVYKVDRLTRSLADFAKIVEKLDGNDASFVSVTQAFNTTTSMGRLTLNVLLSFAQFEREVTGERIRDKVAASKKKGMWMGGPVPFGYSLEDRGLVLQPEEAANVRMIFARYAQLQSIAQLVDELADKGVRTKIRIYSSGRTIGGVPFTKGPLAYLLKNPVYAGKVHHGGKLYGGQHAAIIDKALWDRAQKVARSNGRDRKLGKASNNPGLLTARLVDPDGRPMTPVHTTKGTRRYRYYVTRYAPGEDQRAPWRVPAGELERIAIGMMAKWPSEGSAGMDVDTIRERQQLASNLPALPVPEQRAVVIEQGLRFAISETAITLTSGADDPRTVTLPAQLVTHGLERRFAVPTGEAPIAEPDPVLIRLLAQARAAHRMVLEESEEPGIAHYSKRHLSQLIRIGWLAPDISTAITEGRQPVGLTGRRLLRAATLPIDWAEQRAFLGIN